MPSSDRLAGVLAFDASRSRQSTGALRTVQAGAHLFRAGEPAHTVYAVRQGLLKTVRMNADGDEQILMLNTPGEVLGLEAFGAGTYARDVIAVQSVVCCELPVRIETVSRMLRQLHREQAIRIRGGKVILLSLAKES